MSRFLAIVAVIVSTACSTNNVVPCAGCDPPNPVVTNPALDGGIDDAGNITPEACHLICPNSLGCNMSTNDAGVPQVICGATCGC